MARPRLVIVIVSPTKDGNFKNIKFIFYLFSNYIDPNRIGFLQKEE